MDIEKPATVTVIVPPRSGLPLGVAANCGGISFTPGEEIEMRVDIAVMLRKSHPSLVVVSGTLPAPVEDTRAEGDGKDMRLRASKVAPVEPKKTKKGGK